MNKFIRELKKKEANLLIWSQEVQAKEILIYLKILNFRRIVYYKSINNVKVKLYLQQNWAKFLAPLYQIHL